LIVIIFKGADFNKPLVRLVCVRIYKFRTPLVIFSVPARWRAAVLKNQPRDVKTTATEKSLLLL
jgi:hypothetical protein